jgi:hypothetical protein
MIPGAKNMSATDVFLKLAGEWVMEFHPPVKRRMFNGYQRIKYTL